MVECMKENIMMIKSKVMGNFYGLMVNNLLDIGEMVNNMGQVRLLCQMLKENQVNGLMEKGLGGLVKDMKLRL